LIPWRRPFKHPGLKFKRIAVSVSDGTDLGLLSAGQGVNFRQK
jgi:hypothetical protein